MEIFDAIVKVIGLIGFIPLVITYWMNARNAQIKAQRDNFTAYTQRYGDLIGQIMQRGTLDRGFDREHAADRAHIAQLFLLLSEEFYLTEKKLIAPDVADLWRAGIATTMKHKFFQEGWDFLSTQMGFDNDFEVFIEKSKAAPKGTSAKGPAAK